MSYSNVKIPSLSSRQMRKPEENCEHSVHLPVPPGWILSTFDQYFSYKHRTSPQSLNILVVVSCVFFIGNDDYFKIMISQKSPFFFCHFGRLSETVAVSVSPKDTFFLAWLKIPWSICTGIPHAFK